MIWGRQHRRSGSGDYDGDGLTDRRCSVLDGRLVFLEVEHSLHVSGAVIWGASTDILVPGDYDGDGKTDPAIFRPSTGLWAMLKSSTNFTSSSAATWGLSTDVPINRRP